MNADRTIDMMTINSSWTRRLATAALLAAAPALIALGAPAVSHAESDYTTGGMGCETIHWGFFGADRRKICDGPRQSDGTWQRTRTVFTPAHYIPFKCTTDDILTYPRSATQLKCSGGYPVPDTIRTQESYIVTADTVLPDEPGWLPPGTNNIF